MRLARTRRDHYIAFNMTPMIDIVFLLIIFFMTVSQITRTVDHAVDLPRVQAGGVKARPATITINIDRSGKIIVAGRQLSLTESLSAITKQLEKSQNDRTRIKIQLRVDRSCESGHVSRIVDELAKLDVTQIRVAVAEE